MRKELAARLKEVKSCHQKLLDAVDQLQALIARTHEPGPRKQLEDRLAEVQAMDQRFKEALHKREEQCLAQMRLGADALAKTVSQTSGGYKRGQVRDLAGRGRDLSQAYGNHQEVLRGVTWMQQESRSLTDLRSALGDYTLLLGPGHGAKRGGPATDRVGVEGRELLTHTNRLSRAAGCAGSRSVTDLETWKARFGQPYISDWSKWRSSNYATTRPWDVKDGGFW